MKQIVAVKTCFAGSFNKSNGCDTKRIWRNDGTDTLYRWSLEALAPACEPARRGLDDLIVVAEGEVA